MSANPTTAADLKILFEAAKKARERSYSPYSGAKIGAAIRLRSGGVYAGCNVENSSYGATVCAERTAIQKAVSEEGPKIEITDVLVVTDSTPPWPPCGLCRQVIAEFAAGGGSGDCVVHLADLSGVRGSASFLDFYPFAFTPDHLPNHSASHSGK